MLKVTENDSFGVELGKNFVQSAIASAVVTVGMLVGMAVVGALLDKRKPVFLKSNQKVVTIDEPQE